MHIRLKRSPAIYLAGFMGSGKSTVGEILAGRLGWNFVDIDAEIEASECCTIRDIFEGRGEPAFRSAESAMIAAWVRRVERGTPAVLALGGGAFVKPANFSLIQNHGISIWLDCSFETITARLAGELTKRPLARDPERFRELFEQRREGYERADFRVEADSPASEVADRILELPLWK